MGYDDPARGAHAGLASVRRLRSSRVVAKTPTEIVELVKGVAVDEAQYLAAAIVARLTRVAEPRRP